MKIKLKAILGMTAASFAWVLSSAASTITYDFGQVSGDSAPSGTSPWLQAVFTDAGMPADTVQLTLVAGNLANGAYVSSWYFNFDSTLNPTALNFAVTGSSGSFTGPTVSTGANGFKAGPDGKFDVLFAFDSTGSDSMHFTSGNSLTYTISGITGLSAEDFNWTSTSAGGSGIFASAADIPSIDGSCPAWINPSTTSQILGNAEDQHVPDDASTIMLLGASLAGIEAFRRKFNLRRKQ
jgi:hypothetical protein